MTPRERRFVHAVLGEGSRAGLAEEELRIDRVPYRTLPAGPARALPGEVRPYRAPNPDLRRWPSPRTPACTPPASDSPPSGPGPTRPSPRTPSSSSARGTAGWRRPSALTRPLAGPDERTVREAGEEDEGVMGVVLGY